MVHAVKRDIVYLYHQLAEYSFIMGDLSYGEVLGLPYWNYLDLPDVSDHDRDFIREGCLVMVLAMAAEVIDGTGGYIKPYLDTCRWNLDSAMADDEDGWRLIETVRLALDAAEKEEELPGLAASMDWAYERYVKGYFRSRSA